MDVKRWRCSKARWFSYLVHVLYSNSYWIWPHDAVVLSDSYKIKLLASSYLLKCAISCLCMFLVAYVFHWRESHFCSYGFFLIGVNLIAWFALLLEYASRISNWNVGTVSQSKRVECSKSTQNGKPSQFALQFLCYQFLFKLTFLKWP